MKIRCLFLLLIASLVFAGDDVEPSYISPTADPNLSKQTISAILKAACDGDVDGGSCSVCPGSSDKVPWTISGLVTGHFSSPQAEEAFAGVGSCFYPSSANPLALLLGKRDGKWTKLQEILAFEPGKCMRRKFRSGRDFLICESYDYSRDGERFYSLSTLMVEKDEPKFHNLFLAADNTRVCFEGKAQKAEAKDVEFRDLNGDGLEDISITATYGSFHMSGKMQEQCEAAEDDYIQSDVRKPKIFFPGPRMIKTYKIDLLFDGNRYTPTPESRAAVALFHWGR